mgnify:CR=1 FL=1
MPGALVRGRVRDLGAQVVLRAVERFAELLAAAIDRVEAWDKSQELGPWVTGIRPGIGVRAYPAGSRWGASLRSTWGQEP